MAFFLTLVSIALYYFSPAEIIPTLAPYHIQQFVLIPAVLSSIAVFMMRPGGLQAPQWVLMVGFWFAVVMSQLSRFALRPALYSFTEFGLVVGIYFLVSMNAFSLPRIRTFCGAITCCALTMSILAIVSYHTGYLADQLLFERTESGRMIAPRIRGFGILNDPNDFAQFLLIALAFLGVFWKRNSPLTSRVTLFFPAVILLYAIYLTDSRGAYFGLVVILLIVMSRRLGKAKSVILAGVLFGVLLVARSGGGRDISIRDSSALGRINAWGSGIADIKGAPVFGVGFGNFTESADITAHNSFVLCFAELGFFGYFFWLALLVTTALGLEALARIPLKTAADFDFTRYVTTIRAALYAFLTTSWFLSQTYKQTLYILLALAGVLIFSRRSVFPAISVPITRWLPVTLFAQIAFLIVIYVTVRLRGI
jgi:putative inorganic carbon (HCO3(-)) transporter